MNLKIRLALMLMLVVNICVFAQDSYTITGTVVSQNDNLPVPGVNVIVVNTTNGTSTDFDGNYSIKVSNGDVLQFS